MFSIPIPYITALLLLVLACLLVQRRADTRSTVFVGLCACLFLLVGLRWSLGHPYGWFALAVVSSLLSPAAWLCFYRPGADAASPCNWALQWLPFLAAPVVLGLLVAGVAYWDWVEVVLVALFFGYGTALLVLGWGRHARFDAMRFSQVPEIRRAAVWAGCALIFNGVVEALVGLDYWLYQGRHAERLVGWASIVLLLPLVYTIVQAGRVFASERAALPGELDEQAAPLAALQETPADHPETSAPAPAEHDPQRDAVVLAQLTDLMHTQALFRDPDLSLIKLARRAGVPARGLSAAVNRCTGKNMAQWINGFRIEAACAQLASTEVPITTVMLDCGFYTKSNFNREFRRHTGMSPSAYREQFRQPMSA